MAEKGFCKGPKYLASGNEWEHAFGFALNEALDGSLYGCWTLVLSLHQAVVDAGSGLATPAANFWAL